MKLRYMKYVSLALGLCFLLSMFSSCRSRLQDALESAGENRAEMERVLEYFKNDPDTLKYSAAKFLIENMPYHYTYVGKEIGQYNAAYLRAASEAKEYRDSVFDEGVKKIQLKKAKLAFDIRNIKADFLISAINEACELWHHVNWHHDYNTEIFFDYVLPYRLLNENVSDWRKIVRENYPDMFDGYTCSSRGRVIAADTVLVKNANILDSPSASTGKVVFCSGMFAKVSFAIQSPHAAIKRLVLRYTTIAKDTKVVVKLNDVVVDTLHLEPTNTIHAFKTSRMGVDIKLNEGQNVISLENGTRPYGVDYIQLRSLEKVDRVHAQDYSAHLFRLKNIGCSKYVALDTLKSSMLQAARLTDIVSENQTKLRLSYEGFPYWRISPLGDDKQCLEVRYCSLDEKAVVGKYDYLKGNHQRWLILPISGKECKIINKDTGLCLEALHDTMTNTDSLVQTTWRNSNTQIWSLEPVGKMEKEKTFFKYGSAISEALKVFDQMGKFEWISLNGNVPPKANNLLKYKTGNCRDEASYVVYLSRCLGIPATIDFTPHWGNRSNSHSWSVLLKPNGKAVPFYMGCVPGDTAQYSHIYIKPKIFRRRFQVNQAIRQDLRDEKDVPTLFRMPTFIDVTDEYYKTTDIVRVLPQTYSDRKVVYICVYDNKGWEPVYYGTVDDGTVVFKSMVRGILYSTCICQNGKMIPIGNPYILESNGKVRDIVPSTQEMTLKLYRKYPYMGREDFFNFYMSGGKFQGGNKSDFSDLTDLYIFKGMTEGCWYERSIEDKGCYRYLRYIGPNGSFCNINELEFFDKSGNKLTGKVIGTDGVQGKTKETVFDGNILTGFHGNSPDGHWVGLQLPHPCQIGKIRFIPRNDGNCIEVGDKYQLMMYDKQQWKALAVQVATSNVITFSHIPHGGLYLLSNLTKGSEERIFTYENDKQIWW